jgi:hypothetical protein
MMTIKREWMEYLLLGWHLRHNCLLLSFVGNKPPPPMAESQVCGGVCRVMHIASRDSGLVAHRFEFVRFVDRV